MAGPIANPAITAIQSQIHQKNSGGSPHAKPSMLETAAPMESLVLSLLGLKGADKAFGCLELGSLALVNSFKGGLGSLVPGHDWGFFKIGNLAQDHANDGATGKTSQDAGHGH